MKDKKTFIYLLILSTFLLSMMALLAYADTGITTNARSSALYNPDTNSFLYQYNADIQLPMASTTKIVTALIAIENLDLNEVVRVPKEAVGIEGSSLYLKENDEISVKDLIYSVLLQSANDAATVLALRVSGNISDFALRMTERVASVGAINTQFKNPHGLDDKEHYTTAHDMALITADALSNNIFKTICSTKKYSFKIGESIRTIVNHNKLLSSYKDCIGVKTGYTKRSGRCLVSAAEQNGVRLIAVTLDDPDDWNDHKNMLNYGFTIVESINLNPIVKLPDCLPTISADGSSLQIKLSKNTIVKYKGSSIDYHIDLPTYIDTDVNAGDKIGTLHLKIDNQSETIDIIAQHDLKIKKYKRQFFYKEMFTPWKKSDFRNI